MKQKIKKWLGRLTGIILFLPVVATVVIGNYFVNFAFVPNQGAQERNTAAEKLPEGVESQNQNSSSFIHKNREAEMEAAEIWHEEVRSNMEEVSITSAEGLHLAGHIYRQNEASNQWAVLAHGYQGSEEGMHPTARRYYEAGYNVLTFDQRAMDDSEGKYITMGIKESDDLILWLEALVSHHPDAEIITHGVSMGAATVLMASGKEDFPNEVKAVIADCGYSSVWGVFESELYQRFELSDFPFLHMASLVAIPRVGVNLFSHEGDVAHYTSQSDTPTLFIHGTADDFVPYPMVYELFEAHPTEEKEVYIVEGAGHAEAEYLNPEEYYQTIFNFILQTEK